MQDALSANPKMETTMSPHAVNDLATSFVQMAKAFEELPVVQNQLEETRSQLDSERQAVQDRELSIMKLKQEMEETQAKLRKAEADRDDAEFRFLLADERTGKALEFIKTSFGSAGTLIQALEADKVKAEAKAPEQKGESVSPPTSNGQSSSSSLNLSNGPEQKYTESPVSHQDTSEDQREPSPTPDHQPEQHGSESVDHPTTPVATTTESHSAPLPSGGTESPHAQNEASATTIGHSEGQSEVNPTPPVTVPEESNKTGDNVHSDGASLDKNVSQPSTPSSSQNTTPNTPSDKPYEGKLYINHPSYLRLDEWLAGGGSEANYYYRNDHREGRSWAS